MVIGEWLVSPSSVVDALLGQFHWGFKSSWSKFYRYVKYVLILEEEEWPDQFTILHMSWQLSCRDMCKYVTWLDLKNKNWDKKNFDKDSVLSS